MCQSSNRQCIVSTVNSNPNPRYWVRTLRMSLKLCNTQWAHKEEGESTHTHNILTHVSIHARHMCVHTQVHQHIYIYKNTYTYTLLIQINTYMHLYMHTQLQLTHTHHAQYSFNNTHYNLTYINNVHTHSHIKSTQTQR